MSSNRDQNGRAQSAVRSALARLSWGYTAKFHIDSFRKLAEVTIKTGELGTYLRERFGFDEELIGKVLANTADFAEFLLQLSFCLDRAEQKKVLLQIRENKAIAKNYSKIRKRLSRRQDAERSSSPTKRSPDGAPPRAGVAIAAESPKDQVVNHDQAEANLMEGI
jgi:hypothetical protein